MGLLGEGEHEGAVQVALLYRDACLPSGYVFIKSTQVMHSAAGVFEVPVPVWLHLLSLCCCLGA